MIVDGEAPAASGAVTRVELIEYVGPAFAGRPLTRSDLTTAASSGGARAEVVDVLGRLPRDRKFTRPHDLWHDLHDVPIGR